jgi:RHS repeat-associated protein
LDDQFNPVTTYPQSGAIPVSNFAAGTLGTSGYTGIPITKSGYLYIYVSNESQGWDVFCDNLTMQHRTGPITEETHYYPFGLTMAGISSKAAGSLENKYKYNKGSELQHGEFSDGSGLEMYDTRFRQLDPQLGRWWQLDPKPNMGESPYAAMGNNPILRMDPMGDTPSHPIVFLNPTTDPAAKKGKDNGSINVFTHGTMYNMYIMGKDGKLKWSGDAKEIADAIDKKLSKDVSKDWKEGKIPIILSFSEMIANRLPLNCEIAFIGGALVIFFISLNNLSSLSIVWLYVIFIICFVYTAGALRIKLLTFLFLETIETITAPTLDPHKPILLLSIKLCFTKKS